MVLVNFKCIARSESGIEYEKNKAVSRRKTIENSLSNAVC